MTHRAHDLYRRLRTVACSVWSITPFEFEKARGAGEVTVPQVMDAVKIRMAETANPLGIAEFVWPGITAEMERKKTEQKNAATMQALLNRYKKQQETA